MATISHITLKVNCFHLDSSASILDNRVGTAVAAASVAASRTSGLGEPFDSAYNAALAALGRDLDTLLTSVDDLSSALITAGEAYQGVDVTNAREFTHRGGPQ